MIGDLLQSVGVLVAAYIIYFKVRVSTGREVGQCLALCRDFGRRGGGAAGEGGEGEKGQD